MDKFEENAIKIADYLEDKMPEAEQEAFMLELETDEALRNQFEEELLVRAVLKNETTSSTAKADFFQPADEHINTIKTALEKQPQQTGKISPRHSYKFYVSVAALLLLIITSGIIAIMVKSNKPSSSNITVLPAKNDTQTDTDKAVSTDTNKAIEPKQQLASTKNQKQDTAAKNTVKAEKALENHPEGSLAKNDTTYLKNQVFAIDANTIDSLFKKFYTTYYHTAKDPPELKEFYAAYTKGNYEHVLSATEADYQLMGSGERNELLKQYMSLYKGLSYFATGDYADAINSFNAAMAFANKHNDAFYTAQWHLALSYLKEKNTDRAVLILNKIEASSSPFKSKAEALREYLLMAAHNH